MANQDEENGFKVFNDSVHGPICLNNLLVKIIDTPQFQRLRNIKQLGANYFVYPGATHNRFEHSIGTSYLAGEVARHLQRKQPKLNITNEDILCVEIAGLCHDLGHGPFSHMFDLNFLPRFKQETSWTHEEGSIKMLDHLIKENNLMSELEKYNLFEKDVIFIKELIFGQLPGTQNGVNGDSQWNYSGRGEEKSFLYEIVSNKRNSVDVDKWDYFARDCHHLGIKNGFDHRRFILHLKVLTVEEDLPQICARDKECYNLYEMFHTRSLLHMRAYQHKVKVAVEKMICDAMFLANNHIKLRGENGKQLKISETVTDMTVFTELTDFIFFQILNSDNNHDDMVQAKSILKRIQKRDLYQFVGSVTLPEKTDKSVDSFFNDIQEFLDKTPDHVFTKIKKVNYGMKKENPCEKFLFYTKSDPNTAHRIPKEEVSKLLPAYFQDEVLEIYCKEKENKELAKDWFDAWCKHKKLKPNKGNLDSTVSPVKRPPQGGGGDQPAAKRAC